VQGKGIKFFLGLSVVMFASVFQPMIDRPFLTLSIVNEDVWVALSPVAPRNDAESVIASVAKQSRKPDIFDLIGYIDIIPFKKTFLFPVGSPSLKKVVQRTKKMAKAMADRILIKKADQTLSLMAGKRVLKTYLISLGFSPQGHKTRAGDGKTPEGKYYINGRNPTSRYHRSLKISYPNAQDIAYANAKGINPGGDIMIHGIEKKLCYLGKSHVTELWTRGCVVVTNKEMDEIWDSVPDGTEVEIQA
jgi:hypothetical protein